MCNAALTNLGFAKTSVTFLKSLQHVTKRVPLWDFSLRRRTIQTILEIQTVKVPGNLWDLFILRWILRPSSGCTTRNHKSSPWEIAVWVADGDIGEQCDWGDMETCCQQCSCNEWINEHEISWNIMKYHEISWIIPSLSIFIISDMSRYECDDFLLSWHWP